MLRLRGQVLNDERRSGARVLDTLSLTLEPDELRFTWREQDKGGGFACWK